MALWNLLLVALVQGVTEFLPVSSSGHLILLPALTGLADQGQAIDVAVHVGTLAAVILYFHRDVAAIARGVPNLIRGRVEDLGTWMALCLVVSTIPVVVLGLALSLTGLDAATRSVAVIGWTTLLFGLVLWWTDQRGAETRAAPDWTLRHAAIMGLWQAIALIPGTSRSGITISGARWLGYERHEAARLAMLMSIPTIIASGTLLGLEVAVDPVQGLARDAALAAFLAFLAALAALAVMMRLARRISFTPYVVYRVILGLILLAIAYG